MIDVLVDGLVADRLAGKIQPDSPGNQFWRPAGLKLLLYIVADSPILQPRAATRLLAAPLCPDLGAFVRIAGRIRRDIAAQLARDRCLVPAYSPGYLRNLKTPHLQKHDLPALDARHVIILPVHSHSG